MTTLEIILIVYSTLATLVMVIGIWYYNHQADASGKYIGALKAEFVENRNDAERWKNDFITLERIHDEMVDKFNEIKKNYEYLLEMEGIDHKELTRKATEYKPEEDDYKSKTEE